MACKQAFFPLHTVLRVQGSILKVGLKAAFESKKVTFKNISLIHF